jgi:hypothetical protein
MATEHQPTALADLESDLLDTPAAGPAAVRGSMLRVGGFVIGGVLSIVSLPLLTRHLGFSDYGRYATVISLVTIVQGVTDVGLGQIGVREHATRPAADRAGMMREAARLPRSARAGGYRRARRHSASGAQDDPRAAVV